MSAFRQLVSSIVEHDIGISARSVLLVNHSMICGGVSLNPLLRRHIELVHLLFQIKSI
jgi:hypothetical protein